MRILNRINIVLGVLLAIAAALAIGMDVDHTRPNVEFLSEMKRSPASAAFSANSVFPNGRTLQAPVAGTIPRGDLPLYYTATKEDAVRAGEDIVNPFAAETALEDNTVTESAKSTGDRNATSEVPATSATEETMAASEPPKSPAEPKPDPKAKLNVSVQRGVQIYGVFCVSCHGPNGAGDGPVTKRGFPPPPPLPTGKSVRMKDGQLFHILTWGQGRMSSMAAQLNRSQRWDVINYVRSMQQGAAQSQATQPAATEPDQTEAFLKSNAPPKATAAADEASP